MVGHGWPGQAMDGHCSPWLVMVGQHKPWLAPARHALSVVVRAGQGWLLLAMVGQGRPRLVIAGHEFHLCHPPGVLEVPDRPDQAQQKQKLLKQEWGRKQ